MTEQKASHLVKVLGERELLLVTGTRDQKIVAIGDAQRGRIARRQLLAAGVTKSMIARMLAGGWLRPLHRGVYAVGHLAPIELGRETAALLAVGNGAVISHLTAANLWRMRPARDGPIEVTIPRSATSRRPGIVVHSSRRLPPRDTCARYGLPVTSAARTLYDISPMLRERDVERALDEALVPRIVRLGEVAEVIDRLPGRRGSGTLKALLNQRRTSTLTRSQAEERFLSLIRAAQLPLPEVNVPLLGFTVDFYWREQNVVVEVDGYRFHSTRSAFERDHRKDGVLRAAAVDVQRITWEQMENEPFALVARVAYALEAARARRAA